MMCSCCLGGSAARAAPASLGTARVRLTQATTVSTHDSKSSKAAQRECESWTGLTQRPSTHRRVSKGMRALVATRGNPVLDRLLFKTSFEDFEKFLAAQHSINPKYEPELELHPIFGHFSSEYIDCHPNMYIQGGKSHYLTQLTQVLKENATWPPRKDIWFNSFVDHDQCFGPKGDMEIWNDILRYDVDCIEDFVTEDTVHGGPVNVEDFVEGFVASTRDMCRPYLERCQGAMFKGWEEKRFRLRGYCAFVETPIYEW